MVIYRVLCAILMAWAVNWAFSRSEAVELLDAVPEMAALGPIAGAFVGHFSLSRRQGWGMIVALANGVWAGVLSMLIAGVLYVGMKMARNVADGFIGDYDDFVRLFGDHVDPLISQVPNAPLLIVLAGAAAVAGIASEVLHWTLVRLRRRKARPA